MAPKPSGVKCSDKKCLFINCQRCTVPFTAGSNTLHLEQTKPARWSRQSRELLEAQGEQGKTLVASGCSEQDREQKRAPATSEGFLKPPSSAGPTHTGPVQRQVLESCI